MASKQIAVVALVVVLALVAASIYHAGKTSEVSTPEFSDVDNSLNELESFLDLENQEYDFSMEELYTGWS